MGSEMCIRDRYITDYHAYLSCSRREITTTDIRTLTTPDMLDVVGRVYLYGRNSNYLVLGTALAGRYVQYLEVYVTVYEHQFPTGIVRTTVYQYTVCPAV